MPFLCELSLITVRVFTALWYDHRNSDQVDGSASVSRDISQFWCFWQSNFAIHKNFYSPSMTCDPLFIIGTWQMLTTWTQEATFNYVLLESLGISYWYNNNSIHMFPFGRPFLNKNVMLAFLLQWHQTTFNWNSHYLSHKSMRLQSWVIVSKVPLWSMHRGNTQELEGSWEKRQRRTVLR